MHFHEERKHLKRTCFSILGKGQGRISFKNDTQQNTCHCCHLQQTSNTFCPKHISPPFCTMSDAIKALGECEQQRGSEQHCVSGSLGKRVAVGSHLRKPRTGKVRFHVHLLCKEFSLSTCFVNWSLPGISLPVVPPCPVGSANANRFGLSSPKIVYSNSRN